MAVLLAFGLVLVGCGTYFPVNEPLPTWQPAEGYRASRHRVPLASEELFLMLAFSGGGTRASAFAYGVLEELAVTHAAFDGRVRRTASGTGPPSSSSDGSPLRSGSRPRRDSGVAPTPTASVGTSDTVTSPP
jgi:NTE family protein